jgi:ubiquinone/menaquinone biosynthesis C-methylase UbiE
MQGQGIAYDMQKVAEEDVLRFVSPRRVVSEFNLWQGDHVLDVASGAGHYIPHLRAAVGPKGRVYAHSMQKAHHELLTRDTVARGHHEVVPLLHTLGAEELDIVAGTIDAVLLANVLSARALKTEDLLAEMQRVIHWRSREDTERALIALLAEFNFEPKRALSPAATGSYHYGILFTKR